MLVKAFNSANIYMVNIRDMRNPFIQRQFGNVYETDVTPFIHNGGHTTLNERYIVSQVKSEHERAAYWNIFDVTGSSKLMPLQVLYS